MANIGCSILILILLLCLMASGLINYFHNRRLIEAARKLVAKTQKEIAEGKWR